MDLPLDDNSVDAVTISFGVRNFENRLRGLREILRVLRPGGSLFVLEFSQPDKWFSPIYYFYLKFILPWVALQQEIRVPMITSQARLKTFKQRSSDGTAQRGRLRDRQSDGANLLNRGYTRSAEGITKVATEIAPPRKQKHIINYLKLDFDAWQRRATRWYSATKS